MRLLLVSFFLFMTSNLFSQTDTSIDAARKKEIKDSITKVLKKMSDSVGTPIPVYEPVDTGANPGLDYFARLEERQKKDDKKSEPLKIILAILLLCILIFGLMRKPKKKTTP